MSNKFDSDIGKVIIDKEVIAKLAGVTAIECFGIVGMAALNKRDGLVRLLTRNNITRGIRVHMEEGLLSLDFHIIVAFGVSIPAVCRNLIENVKYQVETALGFPIKNINIFVEGVRVID
ncbi:MAG: Asp23/Gls24 family envelope stress response protein [Parasporobacterium sp.]|nr:Asp23/Gls24 family envelope stress response protein [Parasporobacterium sp.]